MTREEALKQVEVLLKKMDQPSGTISNSSITTESLECIISSVTLAIIDQVGGHYITDDLTDLEFGIEYDGRVCLESAELDVRSMLDSATSGTDILDAVIQDIQDDDFGVDIVFTDEELADQRKKERDAEVSAVVREAEEGKDYDGMSVEAIANSRIQTRINALRDKAALGIDVDAIKKQIEECEQKVTENLDSQKERIERESSVEFFEESLTNLENEKNDLKEEVADCQSQINEAEATFKVINGSINATKELLDKARVTNRV